MGLFSVTELDGTLLDILKVARLWHSKNLRAVSPPRNHDPVTQDNARILLSVVYRREYVITPLHHYT